MTDQNSVITKLKYRPGIKRDGTKFQGEYITDGNWIRFQKRGDEAVLATIGGLSGAANLALFTTDVDANNYLRGIPSLLYVLPSITNADNGTIVCFIASDLYIKRIVVTNVYSASPSATDEFTIILSLNDIDTSLMWQVTPITYAGETNLLFMGNYNKFSMQDNTASLFYNVTTTAIPVFTQLDNITSRINQNSNGGLCFSNGFLFLYGTNGFVQYTRITNVNNISFNDTDQISISSDKVIFAAPIRGGQTSPTILFWTTSSVVRAINVGTNEVNAIASFKVDVVSNRCSILSTRSVVEYDGMFFWPGTDRFYYYNGLVGNMDNSINIKYFYSNLDEGKTQLVYGVKYPAFNEIWWFYPEQINSDKPNVGCTAAIIYNIQLNCWYDVKLPNNTADQTLVGGVRSCGMYFPPLGTMLTVGQPSNINTTDTHSTNYYTLWNFTTPGKVEIYSNYNTTTGVATRVTSSIISTFTTPVYSFASFNPAIPKGGDGKLIDKFITLAQIEPDFVVPSVFSCLQPDRYISINILTKTYAGQDWTPGSSYKISYANMKPDLYFLSSSDQGRQMAMTFSSAIVFELGNIILTFGMGDEI